MPVRVPADAPQKVHHKTTDVNRILLYGKACLAFIGKPLFVLFSGILVLLIWTITGIFTLLAFPFFKHSSPKESISPNRRGRPKKKSDRISLRKVLFFFSLALVAIVVFVTARFIFTLPKPDQLQTITPALSTKIYDRNGNLLYKIYRNENRTLIPLDQIPLQVQQATIAIEDAEFYSHHGFSTRGIVRAIKRNITQGERVGGSTITQQLIKNTLLSPEKTFSRKIKEIVLAVLVEMHFTKDQILEMYLNQVAYGGSSRGVEEASQLYFGKSVRDLDLAESALLVGLPRAPTTYSPFGANPPLAKMRQLEVLSRMLAEGYITQEQAEEAASEKLTFAPQQHNIQAPHFVMYIKQLLVEKYGEEMVEQGGLSVYTSLDLPTQEMAQNIVREEVEKIRALRISNGAALVTNPNTGEILAMVGSKDYFDRTIDGNFNVTTAQRQPGSSIKPVNYSYALESKKYTASSLIDDGLVTYIGANSVPYTPRNYDNTYHGTVTLRTALASSLNIPAVKILASYGLEPMLEQGKKLGITTWDDSSRYGLSITLGGAEVKMTDMSVVYGTFANGGKRVDLHPILKVVDAKGELLEGTPCTQQSSTPFALPFFSIPNAYAEEVTPPNPCTQQVLNPAVAFILTNILSDNNARSLAFGQNSLLVIPKHPEVAVKTGTTQNLRDNWAIGYTKNFTVLVWVGNNNNTPMSYVASGVTGATPIWHNIFTHLLSNTPSLPWQPPKEVVQGRECGRIEYFLEGTQQSIVCPPHPRKKEEGETNDKILQGVATEQRIQE